MSTRPETQIFENPFIPAIDGSTYFTVHEIRSNYILATCNNLKEWLNALNSEGSFSDITIDPGKNEAFMSYACRRDSWDKYSERVLIVSDGIPTKYGIENGTFYSVSWRVKKSSSNKKEEKTKIITKVFTTASYSDVKNLRTKITKNNKCLSITILPTPRKPIGL